MPKQRANSTISEDVLARIDRYAERRGLNRSEAIERLCAAGLEAEEPGDYWEFFKAFPFPISQMNKLFPFMEFHDEDGPCELVLRVPASCRDEFWHRKREFAREEAVDAV